jgi:uncharacterized damage-inducible protein DinB
MADPLDRVFLKFSVDKLRQFASRIESCLDKLSEEQIWMRGSENVNAVGNLVLHLCGNLRQWIGTGVAGKPDIRVRDREFAARGGIAAADLKERLRSTVEETAAIIEQIGTERLSDRIRVQSYDVTVLEAVYHVVEHFAQHTGQIVFATKALTGEDLGFYRHLSKPAHTEPTP